MRIVDRKTFLTLPVGTIYAKCRERWVFDDVKIKGENCGHNDWYTQSLFGDYINVNDTGEWFDALEAMSKGASFAADFDIQARDGMFEDGALFAIYETADVESLITRLHQALRGEE